MRGRRKYFHSDAKNVDARLFVCLPAHCQQCRIQRCNSEYVSSTSHTSGLQDDVALDVDYCIALRAYALCTRRQARSCRGDLVYHSAVFRIKELFSQHNCSSDGPTSSARARGTARPVVPEPCDYESRVLAAGSAGQKKYAHCGLFGDPHLRTFRNEFQTCKVEGAWPLIDNRFLSVQVTNVPVVLGSSATATSKVRAGGAQSRNVTNRQVLANEKKTNTWIPFRYRRALVDIVKLLATRSLQNDDIVTSIVAAIVWSRVSPHSLCACHVTP